MAAARALLDAIQDRAGEGYIRPPRITPAPLEAPPPSRPLPAVPPSKPLPTPPGAGGQRSPPRPAPPVPSRPAPPSAPQRVLPSTVPAQASAASLDSLLDIFGPSQSHDTHLPHTVGPGPQLRAPDLPPKPPHPPSVPPSLQVVQTSAPSAAGQHTAGCNYNEGGFGIGLGLEAAGIPGEQPLQPAQQPQVAVEEDPFLALFAASAIAPAVPQCPSTEPRLQRAQPPQDLTAGFTITSTAEQTSTTMTTISSTASAESLNPFDLPFNKAESLETVSSLPLMQHPAQPMWTAFNSQDLVPELLIPAQPQQVIFLQPSSAPCCIAIINY